MTLPSLCLQNEILQILDTFKGFNHLHVLQLSITPAGAVSLVSKGYGGIASDCHIFEDCGVLEKFEANTSCMVDRGFVVKDLLLSKQVKVYMPHFTKGQLQFTKEKVREGQAIA